MIEQFKYTDRGCEECGGQVVMDVFKGEYYCLKCGLVEERWNPIWRSTYGMSEIPVPSEERMQAYLKGW